MGKTGRFLVTEADDDSAVLADVEDGQVHTLGENPGIEAGDVIDGEVAPEPPLEVTWSLVEVEARWQVSIEVLAEPPTDREREVAADIDEGEIARLDPDDAEAHHVLSVPPEETDVAAEEVRADEGTRRRAARLGASRVEIRGAEGVLGVRYL